MRGRPTDSPKTLLLRVRMDSTTLKKLDECTAILSVSRSQAVREAIKYLASSITLSSIKDDTQKDG